MRIVSRSESETHEIGRTLGRQLAPPSTVLLHGDLGAGKTVLARGIAEGYGIEDSKVVRSPTFTLVNQYPCKSGVLYHVDLYRLEGAKELYSIGLDEILSSEAVVVIEWAEKLTLPVEAPVSIRIKPGETAGQRILEIHPATALAGWREAHPTR